MDANHLSDHLHLTLPTPSLVVVMVMAWSIWSDRVKLRSPFLFSGLFLCLIGFAINITDAPIGVKYFGTYLVVIGGYAAHPAVIAWCVLGRLRCDNEPVRRETDKVDL